MTLTRQAEKAKVKTTAALMAELGHNSQDRFEAGAYFHTRAGDIVRINEVNTFTIYGTLWKKYSCGKWVCFGRRMWQPDGRYFDASFDSLDDLVELVRVMPALEGVAA